MNNENKSNERPIFNNRATRLITTITGIILAVAGFEHGLFEALQGSKPTKGFIIQAIEVTAQRWKYGGEEAFTIIPNFLITGLLAMTISIFIIIWLLFFMRRKNGTTILLLSFILLTLVGGGLGFVPFFLITWAYSTRMNKPLTWWRKTISEKVSTSFAKIWPYTVAAATICWLIVLEIAILGYFPGETDPEVIININWILLLLTLIFINLSYISGFAYDIARNKAL